jgi:GNAT superfamily N-acetyltransferase
VPADAGGIAAVLAVIVAERIHSAIDRAWTVDEERHHIESLSPREAIHLALDNAQGVVGLQSLQLCSPSLQSMAHVGQIATFLLPEWRGRGVGRQLWTATLAFAREAEIGNSLFRFAARILLPKRSIGVWGSKIAVASHARS